jgi:hypothetical protein
MQVRQQGDTEMFNHNDLMVHQERQRDLQREAKRERLARHVRSSARQVRRDDRRLLRVLSLFL